MKTLKMMLAVCALVAVAACSTNDRYNAVATSCQTFAIALKTAATLNAAGKLSPSVQASIDTAIPPAQAVCSGPAPSDDKASADKVSAAIVAVLQAQQSAK